VAATTIGPAARRAATGTLDCILGPTRLAGEDKGPSIVTTGTTATPILVATSSDADHGVWNPKILPREGLCLQRCTLRLPNEVPFLPLAALMAAILICSQSPAACLPPHHSEICRSSTSIAVDVEQRAHILYRVFCNAAAAFLCAYSAEGHRLPGSLRVLMPQAL
jgi:hypothetical protein